VTRNREDLGTCILCSREGKLEAVLRDDLGLFCGLGSGAVDLDLVVDRAQVNEYRRFLGVVKAQAAAFDWSIDVRLVSGVRPLRFAGSTLGDRLLIAAAPSRDKLARLHGALVRTHSAAGAASAPGPAEIAPPDRVADPPGSALDAAWLCDELTRLNNELANLQRALAKTNAELAAKNRELERKSRHKSEFLRAFGHETRMPVSAILSLTRLLERGVDGPLTRGQRSQVGMIRDTAEHMLQLIEDLLDLSKIEAGVVAVRPEAIRVEQLLASAVDAIRPLAEEKGLRVSVAVAPELPILYTDFLLCHRVLLNLLGNAVKFTEHGEIGLAAHSLRRDGEGYLQVQVSDTGIGIAADQLDAVFVEFTQLQETVAGRRGSGLGLALTRRMLAVLGGEIRVESTPGEGSRFSFTLPFGRPATRGPATRTWTASRLPTEKEA